MRDSWTKDSTLPGGDLGGKTITQFFEELKQEYSYLPDSLLHHYVDHYGALTFKILENVRGIEDLGQHFGAELYEVEVDYLIENEWAKTAQDILWRRTKAGLFFSPEQEELLSKKITQKINSESQKI